MYSVGQQLLNGAIFIVAISPSGVITVWFTALGGSLEYDPSGTTTPLEQWAQAIINAAHL